MASLFSTSIVSLCASIAVNGQYNQACNSAVDASTRQIGIRQSVDQAEDKSVQLVTTKTESLTPKPIQEVAGAGFFIYRTTKDKKVQFNLPTMGLCDSVNNEITPQSYSLTIKWNFP